ncbi:MAG: hypothetical protein ACMUIU_00120 [bacterium]
MKNFSLFITIIFVLAISFLFIPQHCTAQTFFPFYSPFTPIMPFFSSIPGPLLPNYYQANPFIPSLSPISFLSAPVLSPSLMSLPTINRSAAATIIVLPPPAPTVTAYAPLGTLSLTPSTLVFLILYLTLAE